MKTDHIKMLCDIGELNGLFAKSVNIENFLQRIVEMVAEHMKTEVCSIYLYNDEDEYLTLKATTGLISDSIDRVKLKLGEGIVGASLKEMKPVNERIGRENPDFKLIPGIGEEAYDAFLAMPIIIGNLRIGVLAVQGKERTFDGNDLLALQATASQLATMIENAKILISLGEKGYAPHRKKSGWKDITFIRGKAASRGFACRPAAVKRGMGIHDMLSRGIPERSFTSEEFDLAVVNTEKQLEDLQLMVDEKLSDAATLIFSSHLLMLKDESFIGAMKHRIAAGEDPVSAVSEVYMKYRNIFSDSESAIIQEKAQDIEDLAVRILRNLSAMDHDPVDYHDKIVIARDLFPSDILALSVEGVAGIVLVGGGVTSHVAILARSLLLPMTIVNTPELLDIPDNTILLVDAEIGNIYIAPSDEVISKFKEREIAKAAMMRDESLARPVSTSDGRPVSVMVNINLLSDLNIMIDGMADGVGLYRSEFPFIIRNDFPSEEEQYLVYRKLVESMKGRPVTIRTLDIGGDKVLPYFDNARESNPFLGMRSIRFSLAHRDIFRRQIRAILRAGEGYAMRIMFPMIASLEDLRESKVILMECAMQLSEEGIPNNANPSVGIMVEIPSAVMIIDDLAKESDFFSIGTNDLVQYTLAVDRTNEKVSHLYVPHHPSVIRSIKRIADAARNAGIDVSICGDMANNERYLPFLVGMGITTLSVDSIYLPRVKKAVSLIHYAESVNLAEKIVRLGSVNEVEALLPDVPVE